MRLEKFYPDASRYGRCTTQVIGNLYHVEDMRFIITLGKGEKVKFPLLDVPVDLIPESVKKDITTINKSIKYRWHFYPDEHQAYLEKQKRRQKYWQTGELD